MAIVAAAALIIAAGFWSAARWQASSRPFGAGTKAVVLFAIPGASWEDIAAGALPNLSQLARIGALGAMTVRTISRDPTPLEAYASLGAGTRVKARASAAVATIARQNRGQHLSSRPGALGEALHRGGLRTAVVGSAALRPAVADFSDRLDAPPADVTAMDPGLAPQNADAALGQAVARLAPGTLVIVFSPTPPGKAWHLEPVVVAGPGVAHGRLTSPSTRRVGLVALTDVAPTVLAALGRSVPDGMIGRAMRVHPESHTSFASSRQLDRDGARRAAIYLPITLAFIVVQALLYAAILAAFWRGGGVGRAALPVRVAMFAIAAFPLSTFLLRAVPHWAALGKLGAVAVLLVIDALLVALATRTARAPLRALAVLFGATAWLVMIDVATGARLQVNSIMGYAPTTAARFFGMGNPAFAVVASTSVLAGGLYLAHVPRRPEALVAVGAFYLVVALAIGAPSLGDNFGGLLTVAPVYGFTVLVLTGRRVHWRTLALGAGLIAALVAVAVGADLIRPPEARTHLGRFAAGIGHHGWAPAMTTIARKEATNLRILTATVWSWLIVVIAMFMLGLLGLQRRWTELLPPGSPHRTVVISALAAGILGFALNDSGSVITALVFVFLGPYLTLLALTAPRSPGQAAAP